VTRERILQASRKVFAESGYDAATFHAIATEIGLTRPAINNYFPSKPALYAEVAGRAADAVAEAVREASAEPTLTGQLIEFLRLIERRDAAESALAGFLVRSAIEAARPPHAGGQTKVVEHVERFVADAVAGAIRRQEISPQADAEAIGDALTGLLWGSAFQISWGLGSDTSRTERMLQHLELLLQRD
jgi:AcrR family transcriptional regulator